LIQPFLPSRCACGRFQRVNKPENDDPSIAEQDAAEGWRIHAAAARVRHGQYRQGERTKAAMAERRKFSALLEMLRAGLT
jgi:hypothetical protein